MEDNVESQSRDCLYIMAFNLIYQKHAMVVRLEET
jgi:hypothetical protein